MTDNFVAEPGVRPGGIRSEVKMTRRDPNFVDVHVGSRIRMRRQLIGMSQEKLGELLKTYLRLGGQEVQINVVRREELLAARENPSDYKDLVVRIAGYCDYFVGLSPQMQEEVLARTEFEEV